MHPRRVAVLLALLLLLAQRGQAQHDLSLWGVDGLSQFSRLLRQEGGEVVDAQAQRPWSPEECMLDNLADVINGCDPGNNTSGGGGIRDATIKLLRYCVLGNATTTNATNNTTEGMKFLLPSGIYQVITNLTSLYAQTTGVPIIIDPPLGLAAYGPARTLSISNPKNRTVTHDAWMITPSVVGDGVAADAYMDLSQLVLYDDKLQWQGLIYQMRSVGLIYGAQVVSLPLSTYSFQLFYRIDTFKRNNWTVPQTWQELVDFSARINGTDGMWALSGGWGPCTLLGTNLVKYILATYHQTEGAEHGWLIDPDTMKLLLDTPAVQEMFQILQGLYRWSAPDNQAQVGCNIFAARHPLNYSHMGIWPGSTYKAWSHRDYFRTVGGTLGTLGVADLPGSDRVLDRATNTLVQCDKKRCPLATWSPRLGKYINFSPGFEAVLVPLNKQSPQNIKFYAYSVVSYLSRPEVSNQLNLDPLQNILPSRTSQLDPQLWAAAGYDLEDATRYCTAHQAAMNHPNLHVQIRIPGGSRFVTLFGQWADSVMKNVTPAVLAATAQQRGWEILNGSFNGDRNALRLEYWSSINRQLPPPPPSPWFASPPSGQGNVPASAASSSDDGINQTLVITLAVILPVCAALILGIVLYRTWATKAAASLNVKPPGVGPRTTLLVSDIEESTTLWEQLDASVMDTAIKLHDTCIRQLAVKHRGYESVWEGDSFIIAFADPLNALEFSMALQKALMALEWPPQLLDHPNAKDIWMRQRRGKTEANRPVTEEGAVNPVLSLPVPKGPAAATPSWMTMQTGSPNSSVASMAGLSATRQPLMLLPGTSSNDRTQSPLLSSSGPTSLPHISIIAEPEPPLHSKTGAQLSVQLEDDHLDDEACHDDDAFEVESAAPSVAHGLQTAKSQALDHMSCTSELTNDAYGPGFLINRPSMAGTAFSGSFTASVHDFALLSRVWTMRMAWKQKFTQTPANTDGKAVLAHRGLRVRVGFHSGLDASADISYNKSSRRHIYTGKIRIRSNAVASAGAGGHTLVDISTMALVRQLPTDCNVYHMGCHQLDGWTCEEGPKEVVLVLPTTLKCRLSLDNVQLRSGKCIGISALDAPIPVPRGVPGSWLVPVLMGMQLSGLTSLLAWDYNEANKAVTLIMHVVWEELQHWRGALSEDGLTEDSRAIAGSDVRITTAGVHTLTPGMLVAAFSNADNAVRCAVELRQRLLMVDWSEELLAHEMCEQVGLMTPSLSEAAASQVVFEQRDSFDGPPQAKSRTGGPDAPQRSATANGAARAQPSANLPSGPLPLRIALHSHAADLPESALIQASQSADGGKPQSSFTSQPPNPSALSMESNTGPTQAMLLSAPRESGDGRAASVAGPSVTTADRDTGHPLHPVAWSTHSLSGAAQLASAESGTAFPPTSPSRDYPRYDGPISPEGSNHAAVPAASSKALQLSARTVNSTNGANSRLMSSLRLTAAPSGASLAGMSSGALPANLSMGRHKVSFGQPSRPVMPNIEQITAKSTFVSDAPVLRGPRVKLAVVMGPCKAYVANTSSGRLIYYDKAPAALHKLVQRARAGQVVVAGAVMQEVQNTSAVAMMVMGAEMAGGLGSVSGAAL